MASGIQNRRKEFLMICIGRIEEYAPQISDKERKNYCLTVIVMEEKGGKGQLERNCKNLVEEIKKK